MKTFPWHIGVVIPARNEEDLLPRCLRSILLAKESLRSAATVDIALISDGSVDRTVEMARRILALNGWVGSMHAGVVGLARREATYAMLNRYRGPLSACWIANTDADCVVPESWLADQLALAKSGFDAVAGTVSVNDFDGHGPEVPARFKASYLISPDGSHPHVHGANLGFRADAYLRAGGWGNLETAEDHDLWRRLAATGASCFSTSKLEVQTSGRRVGRAPNGFAAALAAHNGTAA